MVSRIGSIREASLDEEMQGNISAREEGPVSNHKFDKSIHGTEINWVDKDGSEVGPVFRNDDNTPRELDATT